MTIAVDGWGCGEGNDKTKYVKKITTSANGQIEVTAQAIDPAVNDKTITLTPQDNTGTALTTAAIPTQVYQFKCQPGGGAAIDGKYLPGSCK